MKHRYGDARTFLEIFNPDLQTAAAREQERAYIGVAPTLRTVSEGYGEPVGIVWLCLQMENLNSFASVKEKLSVSRQKELAKLILTEYPYLKVSEILLFFHRLKCGRYGRFYGSVDALFITTALVQFAEERRADLIRIADRRRKQMETSQTASQGITYEEYLELKRKKEQNNETKNEL